MSQWIQLQLPDDLIKRIREIADDKRNSFDAVAVAMLKQAANEPNLLIETPNEVMATYTDEQLWAVVDQRLTKTEDREYEKLSDKNKKGALSEFDDLALDALLHKINFQMLERAKALIQLQNRGYDIKDGYLKFGKRSKSPA